MNSRRGKARLWPGQTERLSSDPRGRIWPGVAADGASWIGAGAADDRPGGVSRTSRTGVAPAPPTPPTPDAPILDAPTPTLAMLTLENAESEPVLSM